MAAIRASPKAERRARRTMEAKEEEDVAAEERERGAAFVTQEKATCMTALLGGEINSYVDLFYLTHRGLENSDSQVATRFIF
jgi:hypothetical protein